MARGLRQGAPAEPDAFDDYLRRRLAGVNLAEYNSERRRLVHEIARELGRLPGGIYHRLPRLQRRDRAALSLHGTRHSMAPGPERSVAG
jgi:hypothetical protein